MLVYCSDTHTHIHTASLDTPASGGLPSMPQRGSRMCVWVCLLAGSLLAPLGQSTLSDQQEELIVELHNRYRGLVSPNASAMMPLRWDPDLKVVAEGYAAKCVWDHNPDLEETGENLFVSQGPLDLEAALENWFLEHLHYDYYNNTCPEDKMCGHYTQMVWADTHRLGCASYQCAEIKGLNWPTANFLVCNYFPAGNYDDERPYVEGDWCSRCPDKMQLCQNNLCVEEAKVSLFMDLDTSSLDDDTSSLAPTTSSLASTTSSLDHDTFSMDHHTSSLAPTTSSLDDDTSSLAPTTSSLDHDTFSMDHHTSSLAPTTSSLDHHTSFLLGLFESFPPDLLPEEESSSSLPEERREQEEEEERKKEERREQERRETERRREEERKDKERREEERREEERREQERRETERRREEERREKERREEEIRREEERRKKEKREKERREKERREKESRREGERSVASAAVSLYLPVYLTACLSAAMRL